MVKKSKRESNIELLRIVCAIMIISSHFLGMGQVSNTESLGYFFLFTMLTNLSRVACSVFVIISAWYSIDKPFNIAKAFHIWLATVMFCLPIVAIGHHYNLFAEDIYILKTSFLPVSYGYGGMWFASVYIILLMISPFLNYVINNVKKEVLKVALLSYIFIFSFFATVFHENGKYQLELVAFVFIYVLTGYIRKYWTPTDKMPGKLSSFLGFLGSWLFISALMALGGYNSGNVLPNEIYRYGEFFYGYFQSIPNLICSFSLFFLFYNMKIKGNDVINWLAVPSYGIIIFHNVPGWNSYFYITLLHSTWHARHLNGWSVVLYGLTGIFLIYAVGLVLEYVRRYISKLLIEDRVWYRDICKVINEYYNGEKSVDLKNAFFIGLPFLCYYITVHLVFWFKENGLIKYCKYTMIIGTALFIVCIILLLRIVGYHVHCLRKDSKKVKDGKEGK